MKTFKQQESIMAKVKRAPVSEKLAEAFIAAPPANPAPSSSDKAYLKGLKKRGYTDDEIIKIALKAGFKITPEMLIVKPKKPVVAPVQAR
jgi:hypothetical protein